MSHPTWVRGLKLSLVRRKGANAWSHPTWVRGLKQYYQQQQSIDNQSHPTWVRGLKLTRALYAKLTLSRTLRGCVD